MKYKLAFLFCLFTHFYSLGNSISEKHNVSFEDISIQKIDIQNGMDSTTSLYILDAGLDKRVARLAKHLRNKSSTSNYRIIAISHRRFSNKLRKRDFIPPNDSTFFDPDARFTGEANRFLDYIINFVTPNFDSAANCRILIGHSFGGLFGVYAAAQPKPAFNEIYSLSPSLWVNRRSAIKKYSYDSTIHFNTPVHIYYGSLEQLNLVAPAIRKFKKTIRQEDLDLISIHSIRWKTHLSIVRCINEMIL